MKSYVDRIINEKYQVLLENGEKIKGELERKFKSAVARAALRTDELNSESEHLQTLEKEIASNIDCNGVSLLDFMRKNRSILNNTSLQLLKKFSIEKETLQLEGPIIKWQWKPYFPSHLQLTTKKSTDEQILSLTFMKNGSVLVAAEKNILEIRDAQLKVRHRQTTSGTLKAVSTLNNQPAALIHDDDKVAFYLYEDNLLEGRKVIEWRSPELESYDLAVFENELVVLEVLAKKITRVRTDDWTIEEEILDTKPGSICIVDKSCFWAADSTSIWKLDSHLKLSFGCSHVPWETNGKPLASVRLCKTSDANGFFYASKGNRILSFPFTGWRHSFLSGPDLSVNQEITDLAVCRTNLVVACGPEMMLFNIL
ncbi:uncharacterized protein [Watersipora subatra]|uniref:uncharacterized protein n=1 Tax=Watersipora subatra TaxID=2589382 RepID=UPI00355B0210